MTAAAVRPAGSGRLARAVTVVVCCSTMFMIAVDTTVVNLALPLIGRGLRAPVPGLLGLVTAARRAVRPAASPPGPPS